MDKEALRKVQLVQLEIAKEIKRVCEENDITYWLDGGTLIGAIRHNGFIPWDDDLDLGMLRKDYERFLTIAPQKLDSKFELVTWKNDSEYPHAFAKVQKVGTVYQEERSKSSEAKNGIWVDVFPFDPLPDDEKVRNKAGASLTVIKTLIRAKCHYKNWWSNGKISIKKWISYVPFRVLSGVFSKEHLISMFMKQVGQLNEITTYEYMTPQGAITFGKFFIPSECFESFEHHVFEDDLFSVPTEYDKYLRHGYGNYMQLPPAEKRYIGHSIIELDFGDGPVALQINSHASQTHHNK